MTNFPTLNQSTTGNAATATALANTPTLCNSGYAAGGIVASGNATQYAMFKRFFPRTSKIFEELVEEAMQ